tara:strand:- start:1023 stop:1445 length:423 start_codon:yes stop_codon:yes gene_type:complete
MLKRILGLAPLVASISLATCVATTTNPDTLGQVLCNIKMNTFQGIFKLIFAISYVTGIFMIVAAVFKLKQVKDNPTQIPVSTPIVLFLCAALMLYLPELIVPAGESIFGSGEVSSYDSVGEQAHNESSIQVDAIKNLLDS